MRKFLIGLIVILAAIAAVVVIGPNFVDWNAYKGQLAAQVEAATGRRLSIDGDLTLSILPTPSFSASGVRLGNIAGATAPDMIRLDTARVRIALAPLLQGLLEVETVELIKPRIELERLADGSTNWTFQPTASPTGSAGGGGGNGFSVPEIKFNDIRVRDGTLVYRDQTSGLVEHIENVNASIIAGSFEGPFRAEGDFRARDLPLQARLAVGRLLEGRAIPVSLVVGVGDESDTAEFSGVLSGFPGTARLNGSLALRSDNTAALLAAFPGLPFTIAEHPAVMEGELTVSSAGISLNGVSLRLARASATGAVQYTFGSPSRLDVVLNVGQVDLDQLFAPPDEPVPASPGARSDGTPPTELPRPFAASRPGVSLFAMPQGLDASLEAKIDALVLNGGILRQVRVAADLSDGKVTLNQASAQLPGGSDISLFGLFVPVDGEPVFDGQLEANSDNFRALLNWLNIDVGAVPAGRLRKLELAAKLRATPDELTISGIDMQLDLSSIRGGVAIALRRRPGFGIGLSVDRINLDAYLPIAKSVPAPAANTESSDPSAPAGDPVVDGPATALAPFAILDRFDAILQLRVGSLTYDDAPVSGVEFDGTLQGGVLDLRRVAVADFAGAGGSASGRIAGLGERPSVDLEVAIDASDASRLTAELGLPLPFRLGAAKLEGNIAGDLDELRFDARLLAVDGEVKVTGNLAGLDDSPRFKVSVDAAHPSFNALIAGLSNIPKTAGDPGRLAFTGSISGGLASAEVELSARLGDGSFGLQGSLADLTTGASGDLALQLRHPNLTTLARTFSPDYRPALADLGEFRLSADLNFDPQSLKMTGLSGAIGPVALQGEADLALAPDQRPRLTASLATSEIILEWFLAPVAVAAGLLDGAEGTADAPRPAGEATVPSSDSRRWSRQPFDLSFLNNLDAELALTAPALGVAGYNVGSPDILIQLDDGKLQLRRFAGALFGGTISMTGDVVTAQPPELNLILSVAGADAPQMIAASRAGKNQDSRNAVSGIFELLFPVAALDLSSGTIGSDMAISSSGRSEFELISNLAGRGEVTFTNAVIDGTDLCAISAQLGNLKGLEGFLGLIAAGDGGATKIDDFIGRFDLARGVATLPGQSIRSECAVADFGGTIDLPRWRIDTRANISFPEHDDFPGIIVEEKGSLDAPNARLVNVNAIQRYLIAKAAANVLRKPPPVLEPVVTEPAAPPPTPDPEQAAKSGSPAPDTVPPQPDADAEQAPLLKLDPFKNLLDALTR